MRKRVNVAEVHGAKHDACYMIYNAEESAVETKTRGGNRGP